jgi:PPOX class probable F420-dependent enzyme
MATETASADVHPDTRSGARALLARAGYLRLITYRRTGDAVATPVWFAMEGETLYIETGKNAGKVKRIRHTPHVGLAPSDMRGRVTGPMLEGQARVLADQNEIAHAESALAQKYGMQRTFYYGLMDLARRLMRRPDLEADYLAISLAENG